MRAGWVVSGLMLATGPFAHAQDTPPPPPPPEPGNVWETPHYDKGFVVVSTTDEADVKFRLRINHVSQFKYTNTLHVDETFTDHLGREHEVQRRHDIQLSRDVFYFSGYAFDERLDFNIILFTSSATLTATAAGYAGYRFHKRFALRLGYFSLPSLRSMTGTYPYFHGTDRSMAVNYMRPGFTQGIWAEGELFPNFNYIAMVGNSLNTLDIAVVKIDNRFAYSLSIWFDLGKFDKPWNDYEYHQDVALRIGAAGTFSREDRLTDLSQANPENNSTFMSDGTLLFGTGTLAEDVTVELANIWIWALDAGIKYRGLAFNIEFYLRYLHDFEADGPVPIDDMTDWGFDASLGYFVLPQRLELYARGSLIDGPFETPYEVGGGFNLYPFDTRGVWINFEALKIHRSPYGGGFYMYSVGQNGLVMQGQFLLRF